MDSWWFKQRGAVAYVSEERGNESVMTTARGLNVVGKNVGHGDKHASF